MKLIFKHQQYQHDAAMAAVECFSGQSKGYRKEVVGRTIDPHGLPGMAAAVDEIFSNKKLELTEEEILKNVQNLQRGSGLKVSEKLEGLNFTVEMETGTGKTYVYTKTMYELYKHYGWSKFIIMVPSVAIREGVHKSLEITAEHFQEIYGKKIRFNIYNTNNKSNLINIKSFADTSNIEVLIMNYQAFNVKKDDGKISGGEASRKIYQKLDAIQSERPIDIIKRARPVLIIDEPQRFGDKAEAIFTKREFNQLFTLRYSATHKKDFNKIYRLDAIDAYNHNLVKKISVKGVEVVGNSGTNSYLFLDRIQISDRHYPVAYIELEVKQKNGVQKKLVKMKGGDNLSVHSNGLAEYRDFIIKPDGINGLENTVSFTNGLVLKSGQTVGDIDEEHVRRIQIREAVKSHLEKERVMFEKGIKVLSLFFIDEVSKYRIYDKNSNQLKGDYARIFEEEYKKEVAQLGLYNPEYNKYISGFDVEKIHKGYFSIDKKGNFINSKENSKEGGISSDENAYDLIMKNKEQLLSFSEPTRFIFSHSALREGWDNPNVFQICTLKHSQSIISKRQEIGRGLRICVNSHGERMDKSVLENDFFDVNKLTVIASESYDSFAKDLQKEIADSLSDRPVKLTPDVLNDHVIKNEKGETFVFDSQSSLDLIFNLKMNGYVDDNYHINDKLIADINNNIYDYPENFKGFESGVAELVKNIYSAANYRAAENDRADNINEAVLKPNDNFSKKEFRDLWNKIKVKTVYEVDFDSEELVKKSINAIDSKLTVKKVLINISSGEQKDKMDENSLKAGNSMKTGQKTTEKAETIVGELKYDLVAEIAKETHLTRKTIVRILKGITKASFHKFMINPESFIHEICSIINSEKAATLINNITYSKTDLSYSDEIFTVNNFKGALSKNIMEVQKHVYNYLRTDSDNERKFAESLETEEVLVYAKLPNGFKIPTPVGSYNPDWAIVFDTDKFRYIYFIAETKGSMDSMQLRAVEEQKISYARKHFAALGHADIKYDVIDSYASLKEKIFS